MQVDLSSFEKAVEALQAAVAASGLSSVDRYSMCKEYDYYQGIPSALLHSGHIATYALTAGMIDPFQMDDLTKPATYLVPAEGPCRYRDENGNIQSFYLSSDPTKRTAELDVRDHVRLAPNSLCFVTLAPEFRLPAYVGARFNLLIRDIYRGLLVGTGPLVDPGFSGRLSIPIHNFTTNEYIIRAGEGLVYFEFTKLSWSNPATAKPTPPWLPPQLDEQPPFPASKRKRRSLDDYIDQAVGGGPPQNAIGSEIKAIKSTAEAARRRLAVFSIAGAIGIAALVLASWSIVHDAQSFVADAEARLYEERRSADEQLRSLTQRMQAQEAEVQRLRQPPARVPARTQSEALPSGAQ